MMEEFKKLLVDRARKQEGKPKDEGKLRAKAAMAKELSDMLGSDLTEDMKGAVKKVTVASDSEEGLKKGLEKAEDILEGEESESDSEDSEESDKEMGMGMKHRYRHGQSDSENPEDIEMKIEELKKQLEELKSKR